MKPFNNFLIFFVIACFALGITACSSEQEAAPAEQAAEATQGSSTVTDTVETAVQEVVETAEQTAAEVREAAEDAVKEASDAIEAASDDAAKDAASELEGALNKLTQ